MATLSNHPVVSLTNVFKTYTVGEVDVPALKGVTFTIPRQRFSVIVGPSGSGKTTLLNLIGCLDRPTDGRVIVAEQDVATLTDNAVSDFRAQKVGFIFQNFSLIPVFSAYENIEYPLLLLGVSATERRRRATTMLEAVGLADHGRQRPNQLSGGQKQRVAIARALVKEPDFVLADEPTANLDSHTGASIIELMRRMQEQYATTFVFSTHDRLLMAHADETFTIRDGLLVDHVTGATSLHPAASRPLPTAWAAVVRRHGRGRAGAARQPGRSGEPGHTRRCSDERRSHHRSAGGHGRRRPERGQSADRQR
jgi:putative ABC transport system ATP-binding protein